jgi:hypothetical protein
MRSNSSESEPKPDPNDSSNPGNEPLSASQVLEHTLYDEAWSLSRRANNDKRHLDEGDNRV